MSAIAGILYPDGRPAHTEALLPATAAMAHLGHEAPTTWAAGCAALAHLARPTTPEAEHERWPLCNGHGDVLVADARLDNRAELLHALGKSGQPTLSTDADLILAAHERWGDDAPAHLVGDFAYALWNEGERLLRLVRSPIGLRALYYRVEAGRLCFATTLRGLRALAPDGLTLNVPWVASFLTLEMGHNFDESLYREIRKVPAAHLLRLDLAQGTAERRRFWDLAPSDTFAGWRDEEWVEGFQARFEEAVAASLRAHHPLALSVSGGLDSSAIALVAHRLPQAAAHPVHSYTLRMPGWPETDESGYREAVVARLPHFRHAWIDVAHAWEQATVDAWQPHMNTPSVFPNAFMFRPFYEQAHAAGCRVKISGMGGDIVTGSEDYGLIAALRSVPWAARAQEWPHFARRVGGARRLARLWLREYGPLPLKQAWQRLRQPPMLPSARCRTLAASKEMVLPPMAGLSPLQSLVRQILTAPFFLQPLEQRAEVLALYGLELRCPFYDRRLLELVFNQPLRLRIAAGQNRVLMKQALDKELPPPLLARNSKADFTRFSADSIAPGDRAAALRLPPEAYLRQERLIHLPTWQAWASRPTDSKQTVNLYRVAHLENWLVHQIGSN